MPPFAALVALYTLIFVLHVIVPGRWVAGYARDEVSGDRLVYRLNGPRVLAIVVGLYFAGGALGSSPGTTST